MNSGIYCVGYILPGTVVLMTGEDIFGEEVCATFDFICSLNRGGEDVKADVRRKCELRIEMN